MNKLIRKALIFLSIVFLCLLVFLIVIKSNVDTKDKTTISRKSMSIKEEVTIDNELDIENEDIETKESNELGVTAEFIEEKIKNKQNFILYIIHKGHENKEITDKVILPLSTEIKDTPVVIYSFDIQNPSNNLERSLISNHTDTLLLLYYKDGKVKLQIDRLSNYEGLKVEETIQALIDNARNMY